MSHEQDRPAIRMSKILLLVSEDWFALSHFQPLIRTLTGIADDVVVATRSSGRVQEIAALGARVIPIDVRRSSMNPLEQLGTVRRLFRLIKEEDPDVVHVIAMQPMVLTSLALQLSPEQRVMMHLTGLGFLGISQGHAARLMRPAAFLALGRVLKRQRTWLLAENPDDAAYLKVHGLNAGDRLTFLGGAGLDIKAFPALPQPDNAIPIIAFVGRMIRSKGLEVLVAAKRELMRRNVDVAIHLYGRTDEDNPDDIPASQIEAWQRDGLVSWFGHVADIRSVWARANVSVLPAITREGMPRAVLEAAACERPLIVTDVPGCRHFVRDGIEGLIVPPGNAIALAEAIQVLIEDPKLAAAIGARGRQRVLDGFTERHVCDGIRLAYHEALMRG